MARLAKKLALFLTAFSISIGFANNIQYVDGMPYSTYIRYQNFKKVLYALVQESENVPYEFGGNSIYGVDCSAFVMDIYRYFGIYLPRTAAEQSKYGRYVIHRLRVGDLLFFKDTYKPGISHVAIYLGDGLMAEASSLYGRVVVVPVKQPFYIKHFAFAKRIFNIP